ncbi:2,3-dihydroxyphenylpropionate/2,3-dihydroxicinnamic acid 1,2-dioxygenase [mine drainage metagenome]|uniref:2,3-dihydroxyphenylpropionate/2, 3-dihydroxicinnamic acid 1,2-dioxygenase n=1 Tax=mine drainage metagenome TaxID=410659 RepID=A0A1J5QBL6_9ZZZZ
MSRASALFVSHGSPMLPLEPGSAAPMLRRVGSKLDGARAILAFSPHWMTRGVVLGAAAQPATIHDFSGFDPALYTLRYPVAGDPELARSAAECLRRAGVDVALDPNRGLDHGVWNPLLLMRADADVPVVPLAMPWPLDAAGAWRLGEALAPLRDDGVVLLGSGSLTHNLYEFDPGAGTDDAVVPYVREFVAWMRDAVARGDREALLDWQLRAPHARRAHPTPEHLLPLFWALGAAAGDAAELFDGGVHYGMLSMDAWAFA